MYELIILHIVGLSLINEKKNYYLVFNKIYCVFWLYCFCVVIPADPIAQLHRCFCRKLLERAVHTLIQPQSDSEAGKHKSNSG